MKQFETFGLDTLNECLWRGGDQIALAPKPFAVLRYLVENPGRLITHDELLDALWPETYVQPQVLRTYMLELRKVLGDDPGQPRFIQTLPKRGYRFIAQVRDDTTPDRRAADRNGSGMADQTAVESATRSTATVPEVNLIEIVGRDEELGRLRAQLKLVAGGERRVIFITGEAGIGKTALVDAFYQELNAGRPAPRVARGQCVEGFGSKEEYYPVMEALSQLCSSADGEMACRVLAKMAPVWLGALGREPNSTSQGKSAGPERMPGDLCAALEELAAEKPLILIFEDMHWADAATLHLISALARRRAQSKLMIVTTCQPRKGLNAENGTGEHPLKELKRDLLLRRLCIEMALAPLTKPAVKELLARELKQQALPPGLASFVHQHSEGNPLFVIAILEHLIAERFLVHNKAATLWEQRAPFQEMEAGVPDGLAQMIELEMERLTAKEQRLLEAGSLMSVAFPAWAVAAALEEDEVETEEACDALARRLYFVERAGQDELPDGSRSAFYSFAHGLYREVLYQRQAATRRAKRHMRIAERLGQLFAGREAIVAREMAMHYEAAGDWRRAVHALRTAAQHAQERQAPAETRELLEHALRMAENLSPAERTPVVEEIRRELTAAFEALGENSGDERKMCGKV